MSRAKESLRQIEAGLKRGVRLKGDAGRNRRENNARTESVKAVLAMLSSLLFKSISASEIRERKTAAVPIACSSAAKLSRRHRCRSASGGIASIDLRPCRLGHSIAIQSATFPEVASVS